uniref:Uncharacterized protein n=1 Tax=Romanomermis culicivorax TaxID=13658 RepID=A0A915KD32_ROMCU
MMSEISIVFWLRRLLFNRWAALLEFLITVKEVSRVKLLFFKRKRGQSQQDKKSSIFLATYLKALIAYDHVKHVKPYRVPPLRFKTTLSMVLMVVSASATMLIIRLLIAQVRYNYMMTWMIVVGSIVTYWIPFVFTSIFYTIITTRIYKSIKKLKNEPVIAYGADTKIYSRDEAIFNNNLKILIS